MKGQFHSYWARCEGMVQERFREWSYTGTSYSYNCRHHRTLLSYSIHANEGRCTYGNSGNFAIGG